LSRFIRELVFTSFEPGIQFVLVGVYGSLLLVLMPPDRKTFRSLPTLHGPDLPLHVGRNSLPGIEGSIL
jgi:hypothetical protein